MKTCKKVATAQVTTWIAALSLMAAAYISSSPSIFLGSSTTGGALIYLGLLRMTKD